MAVALDGSRLREIYRRLFAAYGPQHWWPAASPFEVVVGAVLTQNTAWPNVERAIANLRRASALDPERIATLPRSQLAELLRPSGYFNLKADRLASLCGLVVARGGMERLGAETTEQLRIDLLQVRGVGPETADDILLYAFNRLVFVIDTYTRRLLQRLGMVEGNEGYEELRQGFERGLAGSSHRLPAGEADGVALGCGSGDAQYFNEYHALIVRHAKVSCRKRPVCAGCVIEDICAKCTPPPGQRGARR